MTPPVVIVYSRPGCHLCEHLLEELAPLLRGRARLEVRNIDDDPACREAFGTRIPVVEIDGRVISEYTLDRTALERALDARRGRDAQEPALRAMRSRPLNRP